MRDTFKIVLEEAAPEKKVRYFRGYDDYYNQEIIAEMTYQFPKYSEERVAVRQADITDVTLGEADFYCTLVNGVYVIASQHFNPLDRGNITSRVYSHFGIHDIVNSPIEARERVYQKALEKALSLGEIYKCRTDDLIRAQTSKQVWIMAETK